MTKRKFDLAKVVWLIVLCFGISFFSANNSQALPITVTKIVAKSPDAGTDYLTRYWLETVQYDTLDAFCVENAGVDANEPYELVAVPTSRLGVVAGYASRYFDGSVLGLSSDYTEQDAKVATQLAIWLELGIITSYDVSTYGSMVSGIHGLFKADSSILDSIYLARSPIGGGVNFSSQDYLVSIPDASVMFLLGSALLGLGLFGRRKKSET